MSWNNVDSDPRRSFGASSARYAGVSADAAPTARPRMMRAITIIVKPVAAAHRPDPSRNRIAETMSSFLRPNRSESEPIDNAPMQEPLSTDDVMKPVWATFSRNSSSTSGRHIGDDAGVETEQHTSQCAEHENEGVVQRGTCGVPPPTSFPPTSRDGRRAAVVALADEEPLFVAISDPFSHGVFAEI